PTPASISAQISTAATTSPVRPRSPMPPPRAPALYSRPYPRSRADILSPMNHEAIKTDQAAPPAGPYNQGVRWDRLIFTASVPARNPRVPEGDVKQSARACLENVKAIVEAGGSSLDHVVKVTLYLRDMDDFAA